MSSKICAIRVADLGADVRIELNGTAIDFCRAGDMAVFGAPQRAVAHAVASGALGQRDVLV